MPAMTEELLKTYATGFSVLYVEDDPVGATIIKLMLERFFERVYGAENGVEGVRQFRQHQPDLIVTDLMMPELDGIGMLRQIRTINQKTPVVLMTASLEHLHLVEAINLGVSKFLAKPIRADALQRALLAVTRELHLERVAEQARQQELELLNYRNRYHSLQQELARAKEHHIAGNQLEHCYLPADGTGGWLVDLVQRPRDIMSGDSYSVIRTPEGTLQLFLADAMGHGLSASVTSMLTTAFFNHAARECTCGYLGFSHVAVRTMQFAMRNLLEDEVFSGLVLELDPRRGMIRFASCGMPALLLVRHGQIERVRGINPPVTAFSPQAQLQELSLEGVSGILLASDGLGDAAMRTGGCYRDRLTDDFRATVTADELFACYQRYCDDTENDDDITLVRLIHIGSGEAGAAQFGYSCKGSLKEIETLQQRVKTDLVAAGATGERLDSLELALSEALLNALEHGCLGMGVRKQELLLSGEYDDLVMEAHASSEQQILLTMTLMPRQGRLQAWIEVADPGPGCDLQQDVFRNYTTGAVSGRGLKMMRRSVDLVRLHPAGNRVVVMQLLDLMQETLST